jgi:hypothetical protein
MDGVPPTGSSWMTRRSPPDPVGRQHQHLFLLHDPDLDQFGLRCRELGISRSARPLLSLAPQVSQVNAALVDWEAVTLPLDQATIAGTETHNSAPAAFAHATRESLAPKHEQSVKAPSVA